MTMVEKELTMVGQEFRDSNPGFPGASRAFNSSFDGEYYGDYARGLIPSDEFSDGGYPAEVYRPYMEGFKGKSWTEISVDMWYFVMNNWGKLLIFLAFVILLISLIVTR